MLGSRRNISERRKLRDEIAFPISFGEQARYLELANRFLELDHRRNGSSKVVPIDRGRRVENGRLKKAS